MLNSSSFHGLPEEVLKKISHVFRQVSQIKKVIIYGSRSRGTYHSTSDIDLTIAESSLEFSDFLRLAGRLDDLMLPWKIDLSILEQIDNSALVEDIARTGRILFLQSDAENESNFLFTPAKTA